MDDASQYPRRCTTCIGFGGWTAQDTAVVCVRDKRRGVQVRAQPEHGCAFWEREPGSDDELVLRPNGEPLPESFMEWVARRR